jgi:hypothetical protein
MIQPNKPKWLTVKKAENAYAVLALVCTGAGTWKLATLPKVHTAHGPWPAWQFVAGIVGAGLLYSLFHLIDGESK